MGEIHNQVTACDGKQKHSTELAVQYHITENQKEGVEDYYKCHFCDNFHTFTLPGMKKLSNKKFFNASEKRTKKPPRKMKFKHKPGRRKR